jgi:hypothetical protein
MIHPGHLALKTRIIAPTSRIAHLRAIGAGMASTLADMWNDGLLLFYGSIALVIALDIAVKLAGDGKEREEVPGPSAPISGHPGTFGVMIEGTP